MDKPNAIYKVTCKRHNETYVGETSLPLKVRAHNHRIIPRKQSTISHSLPAKPTAATRPTRPATMNTQRRSTRQRNRVDYHAMHTGSDQLLSEGNSAVSQHMATEHHQPGDVEIKPLAYEKNWHNRRFKEALAICDQNPTLNRQFPDPNTLHVPAIYSNLSASLTPTFLPKKRRNGTGGEESRIGANGKMSNIINDRSTTLLVPDDGIGPVPEIY